MILLWTDQTRVSADENLSQLFKTAVNSLSSLLLNQRLLNLLTAVRTISISKLSLYKLICKRFPGLNREAGKLKEQNDTKFCSRQIHFDTL